MWLTFPSGVKFPCWTTPAVVQRGTVAKDDDGVASASTKIRLFLDADWLIAFSFQPQAWQTRRPFQSTYTSYTSTHKFTSSAYAQNNICFLLLDWMIWCWSSQCVLSKTSDRCWRGQQRKRDRYSNAPLNDSPLCLCDLYPLLLHLFSCLFPLFIISARLSSNSFWFPAYSFSPLLFTACPH